MSAEAFICLCTVLAQVFDDKPAALLSVLPPADQLEGMSVFLSGAPDSKDVLSASGPTIRVVKRVLSK